MRRFYIPQIPSSGMIDVEDSLKHRIGEVLRFLEGEELELVDGKGRLAKVEVVGKGKKISFLVKEVSDQTKTGKKIIALVSLIRRERFDTMVEKAVELGADVIIPFVCERSRPYSDGAYDKLKDRWQRIADQTLSQCRRLFKCELDNVVELKNINFKDFNNCQLLAFNPGAEVLLPSKYDVSKDVIFAIGPEGGFSDYEIKFLSDKGFNFYSLTDNILRTETAVMYVLSVIDFCKKI